MLYQVLKRIVWGLARLVFRLETRGTQYLPAAGPVLMAANHASFLDPPLVAAAAPRQLHFLAKEELFRIPLLGRLIRAVNARPVRRGGSDPVALRTGLRILEDGGALLIFPEGTRGEEDKLREPRPGAGMLAVLSGAPVLPTLIEGSGRALPRGRWLPRWAKIRVSFGPPFSLAAREDSGRRNRYLEASRQIMTRIAEIKEGSWQAGGPETASVGVRPPRARKW